jgi:hypothetical protein
LVLFGLLIYCALRDRLGRILLIGLGWRLRDMNERRQQETDAPA